MSILQTIFDAEKKGIVLNHTKIRKQLNIKKPTMKKRVEQLALIGLITEKTDGKVL